MDPEPEPDPELQIEDGKWDRIVHVLGVLDCGHRTKSMMLAAMSEEEYKRAVEAGEQHDIGWENFAHEGIEKVREAADRRVDAEADAGQ
jgi:hypothetical protein